ncbi:MAG: PEP-CTERM sorting domain-containing protein [Armatimonadota bacterium]
MKAVRLFVFLSVLAGMLLYPSIAGAQSNTDPFIQLSADRPGVPNGIVSVIEIPPDDWETFWAHIGWAGHEGQPLHIDEVSWHYTLGPTSPGQATSVVDRWIAQPSQTIIVSEWFQWNVVHTVGVPSSLINFQADIILSDLAGNRWGPLYSNIVTKHITPEPSSLLAMGTGVIGMGGLVWRRRKAN